MVKLVNYHYSISKKNLKNLKIIENTLKVIKNQ